MLWLSTICILMTLLSPEQGRSLLWASNNFMPHPNTFYTAPQSTATYRKERGSVYRSQWTVMLSNISKQCIDSCIPFCWEWAATAIIFLQTALITMVKKKSLTSEHAAKLLHKMGAAWELNEGITKLVLQSTWTTVIFSLLWCYSNKLFSTPLKKLVW